MYGRRVATELRRRGHDVVGAQERPELRGRTDREVLALATSEQRAVVTEHVGDFARLFNLFAAAGESHAGIVPVGRRRFPRTTARSGDLVRALGALLRTHKGDDELRDGMVWL